MSFFSRLAHLFSSDKGDGRVKTTRPSQRSDADLSQAIKAREAEGHTGRTDPTLHKLNRDQTDRLSTKDIRSRIAEREAQGLPTGKLHAALRDRGG